MANDASIVTPRAKTAPANRSEPVDFIVIGAMRAGTTTLHGILSRHPAISMSRDKETDFFIAEKNYPRGLDWYTGQFDPRRRIRGEISPNYSKARDFRGVPARVAQHAPGARLVYVVRDPVQRAVSQFAHGWHMGALAIDPRDLPESDEYQSLIDISSYARQLDHWQASFPGDRFLVVDFDAFLAQPDQQIDRILRHVGADPIPIATMTSHNATVELSRVPRPLLRLAQGRLRPMLTSLLGQRAREALRGMLAIGPRRHAPAIPDQVLARMRADLSADAERFRRMTGMELGHWSV